MNSRRVIVVASTLSIVLALYAAGPIGTMVKEKRTELERERTELEKKRTELSNVYTLLKRELIEKIDHTINHEIRNPLAAIEASQDAIKHIPPVGLQFAGIGDINNALDSIKGVLVTTQELLKNVRDRFGPIVDDLSPTKDPQGIYAGFAKAVVDMNNALSALRKFEDFTAKLGI
jgi:signal transduction histidine kinase